MNVGQLVLSSKDGFAGLFRAVVVKQDNSLIVTVKYIDFPGEADLSVKSLRNVDEFLAAEPATILITPEFKCLENLTEQATEYILTICQNKEKFKLVCIRCYLNVYFVLFICNCKSFIFVFFFYVEI